MRFFAAWVIVLRQHMYRLLSGWLVLILANASFSTTHRAAAFFGSDQSVLYCRLLIALFYQKIPYKTNGVLLLTLVVFILCPFFSTATISIFTTCFILCTVCVLYEPVQQFRFLIELGNASYSIYLTHLTIVGL